jgi:Flp pilus assembly protein TadG
VVKGRRRIKKQSTLAFKMTGSFGQSKDTLRRLFQGVGRCRRGVAALEFGILAPTLLMLLFGFVATGTLIFTWSAMQSTAQYAALMVSTGQVKSLSNGAITTSNTTATTTCSGSLTTSEAEYYACHALPSWATFTVTTTENCAVPSVTVSVSASGSTAAIADVFDIFTGRTLTAEAVVMKEGQCP